MHTGASTHTQPTCVCASTPACDVGNLSPVQVCSSIHVCMRQGAHPRPSPDTAASPKGPSDVPEKQREVCEPMSPSHHLLASCPTVSSADPRSLTQDTHSLYPCLTQSPALPEASAQNMPPGTHRYEMEVPSAGPIPGEPRAWMLGSKGMI